MGRPKGSKNRPKSETESSPQPRPATTDHAKAASKTDLTDDQLHSLTAHHSQHYAKALAAKKLADAAFKNVCKLAKAEGVSVDDIKTYIDLDSEEGQARLRAKVEAAARIARWKGASLGTQFSLFDESETNSFQAGKEAGMAGHAAKAPAGRDVNEWMRGWQVGQQANLARIKQQKQEDADEFDAIEMPSAPSNDDEDGEHAVAAE